MALWQRQIQAMESFHRDMILTVQMFFAMHREQHALVRDEIAKVQQITQEMKELQEKLAELSKSAGNGHRGSHASPASSHSATQDLVNADTGHSGSIKPPGPRNGHEDPGASGLVDQSTGTENAELHQKLTMRINELQRERQGYWQRILTTLKK